MYINLSEYNLPKFRQDQLNNAIFKNFVDSIDEISTLPNDIKDKIKKDHPFPTIKPIKDIKTNDVFKQAFETLDNKKFESVLISHKDKRETVCISSQAGCPIGCKFCATGLGGFERDLTYKEIIDQVLHFARILKKEEKSITNIVFMGMGEPFLNTANLSKSIDIINNPEELNFSSRRITISTIWTGENILKFVEKHPQVNIALSLHSAIQEKREDMIPIAKKITLDDIKSDIKKYFEITNRRLTLEYLMLKEINDSEKDLEALIAFIESISRKLLHVNLLPYNDIRGKYKPTAREEIINAKRFLEKNKINTTIRKSMGFEINSACGMLKNTTSLPQ